MIYLCSSIPVLASAQDNYTIISPNTGHNGIIYCDNLLFSLYDYPNYSDSDSLSEVPALAFTEKELSKLSDDFKNTDQIFFYTKQIKNIKPGLYSLQIDILDDNNIITDTYNKYFIVKPNSTKLSSTIYQSKPSKKVMFFQKVFKNLFG